MSRVTDRDRQHFAAVGAALDEAERADLEAARYLDPGEKILRALQWSDAVRGPYDASEAEIVAQASLKSRWLALHGAG